MKNSIPKPNVCNVNTFGNAVTTAFIFLLFFILWVPVFSQTFIKVTDNALTNTQETLEPSWCDYDDDGDMDVFINVYSPSANNLHGYSYFFQNNCNGDFTQIKAIPGNITKDVGSWMSDCSWIDYNNDGFTDLYTSHGGPTKGLYSNNGDGTFTQITDLNIVTDGFSTRGSAWADYNNDGYLDVFLCNNPKYTFPQPNCLYSNNGDGTFTRILTGSIATDQAFAQSAAWGDYDNGRLYGSFCICHFYSEYGIS